LHLALAGHVYGEAKTVFAGEAMIRAVLTGTAVRGEETVA